MFDILGSILITIACYGVVHFAGNTVPETRAMDKRSRFAMELVMAMAATAIGAVITGLAFHA